jgi:hypothetical protein
MHHEVVPAATLAPQPDPGIDDTDSHDGRLTLPNYVLEGVSLTDDHTVRVTGVDDGDVDLALVRLLEEALAQVSLRPSDAARVIVAVRQATDGLRDERPFTPLSGTERDIEAFGEVSRVPASSATPAATEAPSRTPMTVEHQAQLLERRLARLGAWWHQKGDRNTPVTHFVAEMNRAGGIPSGGRAMASVKQLQTAWDHGWRIVQTYCKQHGLPEPKVERWT